jgi:hypothetical protein
VDFEIIPVATVVFMGGDPRMANHRTAWHVLFVAGLSEHHPPGFDVLPEQLLSNEPLRADLVLVRRREGPYNDAAAGTLRRLWPLIGRMALVEFKSPGRPLRPGELAKLFGYGGQYHALHFDEVDTSEELLLVLVVALITPTLTEELRRLRLRTVPIAPGYLRAEARPYTLLVVDLSAVVEADGDELMAIFVRNRLLSLIATRFMEQHRMTPNAPQNLAELEDYHEVVQRWLSSLTPAERLEGLAPAERLEGLAPAERLEGLAPAERVEGLTPEQLILTLPDETLRSMSDDYLRTLSAEVQQAVRHRIGRPA